MKSDNELISASLAAIRREEIIDSRQKVQRRQSYMESDTGW